MNPEHASELPMTESNPERPTPEEVVREVPTAEPAAAQPPSTPPARAEAGAGTVDLRGLHAYYGSNHAVRGVDLRFDSDDVTAIIGPSGCGKSTMVRCINRMHEEIPGARAEGEVLLDEIDLYDAGGRRRRRPPLDRDGVPEAEPVPDDVDRGRTSPPGLRLTGAKRGDDRGEGRARRCEAPASGTRSRTASTRPERASRAASSSASASPAALAVDPEVLLMDEPCSALDPVATLKIEELIGELKEQVTIVIVTHNMQQAARVADTTAFMLDGELSRGRRRPTRSSPTPTTIAPSST